VVGRQKREMAISAPWFVLHLLLVEKRLLPQEEGLHY
jgi:hypothetical protein